ncbi:MAG: CvpA family protein [Candidatus Omnitrophica bacterium]|nr:CvpA family protein [Candidatus Omnitrophota bacterium]
MDILKHLNWVDIVVAVIAIRIIFVSSQTGFVVEFLKLLAAVVAVFVSFHYFTGLAAVFVKVPLAPSVLHTVAFVLLWGMTLLICRFIRDGFLALFSVQAQDGIDKWGAAVISIGRVVVTASVVMFVFLATGQKYMETMTLSSFSSRYILAVSPNIYISGCDHVVTRLFPTEKKNPAVAQIMKSVAKK